MEENTNLELDMDSVNSRNGVRSSLTDLNGIFVFTDEFQEQKESVDQQKKQQESDIVSKMFGRMTLSKGGEEIIPRLFSGEEEELVIRSSQTEGAAQLSRYQTAGLALAFALLWAGILLLRGKGKKRHDVNDKLPVSM